MPASKRNSPLMIPLRTYRKIKRLMNPPTEAKMGRVSLDAVSLYDPPTDRWTRIGTIPKPLYACAAAVVGDTLVVTNGGLRAWKDASAHTFVASLADFAS
ncbi:MAG: kelch repeat-containing protein [Planctomycetota bacterium]